MRMVPQEELEQIDHSFCAKIIRAKPMTIQDGRTDDRVNNPAKQNEEPLD